MFRNSPPEVLSMKDAAQIRSNPQRTRFATLLKSHPCAHKTSLPTSGRSLGRMLLYVKRVLNDLNYKKLLFAVVKRNLLTLKNK